jgi:osmotically-inducible protein OsmY
MLVFSFTRNLAEEMGEHMRKRALKLLAAAGVVLAVACSQSDPGITTAVKAKFAQDDTVKAYQLDVDTSNRVVTLTGSVETAAAKDRAVMLARQTDGVSDVVDQITVSPQAAATTGDLRDEARDAGAAIREETREATEAAKEGGRELKEEAREAGAATKDAARDARATAGDAVDRSQAVLTDAAITSAVKTKMLADTTVAGLKIDVDTNAGVVTLNGMASTRAEADRAVALARGTDGVKRVVNNLKIGH